MEIYKATKKEFLEDVKKEKIVTKIIQGYEKSVKKPEYGMINSWNGSIPYLYLLLEDTEIPDNCGISIEHEIPNIDTRKRIDVLISGKNKKGQKVIIEIELKQWSKVIQPADKIGYIVLNNDREERIRIHPSFQAASYIHFLTRYNSAFSKHNIQTYACALLHNYESTENDVIFDEKYKKFIEKCPLFLRGDLPKLREFIKERISEGDNCETIDIIENTPPSLARLITPEVIDITKETQYITLVDEQEIVYEKAIQMAEKSLQDNQKRVFIVQGGPGSGKSVLALKIFGDILENKSNLLDKIDFVTPIQAQRKAYEFKAKESKTYKKIKNNIKSPSKFVNTNENTNNISIVDEAHRLKEKSGMYKNIGENQIKEIIKSSKCSIFFIDELQRITLDDKGSIDQIKKFANEENAIIDEYTLSSQFRCSGSGSFVSWVEDVLQIKNTANHDGFDKNLHYDIRVVDTPNELRRIIVNKNKKKIAHSRIVAGYCWDSKKEARDDPKIKDIKIEKYKFYISWNLQKENWAVEKGGEKRAGCVYTCQGFDFDYVGVIIGKDLIYRDGKVTTDFTQRAKTDSALHGIKEILKEDKEYGEHLIDDIIKRTYRILLTRGRCGCIIFCEDDELQKYFKRRINEII